MMTPLQHAQYIMQYIDTYREHTKTSIAQREAACLAVQFPAAMLPIQPGDLLVGRYACLVVGFGMQENGMGYFLMKRNMTNFCHS